MRIQLPPPSNDEEFESLYLEICKLKYPNSNSQKVGCSGQKQKGVDIIIPEKKIGVQCKKREYWEKGKITKAQLKKVIDDAKEFQPPLKQLIIATTCKRDAGIQEVARQVSEKHKQDNLFFVQVESWNDIEDLIHKHPEILKMFYSKFFPQNSKMPKELYSGVSSQQSEGKVNIYNMHSSLISLNFTLSSIFQELAFWGSVWKIICGLVFSVFNKLKIAKKSVYHGELNRIKKLIESNKPETAFRQLEELKTAEWYSCSDSVKYRILTNMGCAQMSMGKTDEACNYLIRAYHYNKADVHANTNCASAYLLKNDLEKAKKYIDRAEAVNPYDEKVYKLFIQFYSLKKQSINQILRNVNIPENVRQKSQVAFYLSQAAINSNEPEEIKKWAKIAYDNNDREDHYILSHYASVLLIPIQKKLDSFIVKKAVDKYKPDILEAVKIYKKLISDQKYSEIKKFHPEWYVSLSVAYEFLGEVDESIKFIRIAISEDSENIKLKLRLVELLLLYKNIVDEGIEILEDIKDDPETPLESQIILSEALFLIGDYERWNDVLNKVINLENVSQDIKTEAIRSKIFRLSKLERYEEAEKTLQVLKKYNPNEVMLSLTLESIIKAGEGDIENAKLTSLKASSSITRNTHPQDINLLANEMYKMKLYEECEPLFEKVVGDNYYHPSVYYLLSTYYKNGKNDKALELADILNKKNLYGDYPTGLMSSIYEENGDIKNAIRVCKNFLSKNPDNKEIQLTLSSIYIRDGKISEAKDILLNNNFKTDMSSKQIVFLSQCYMEIGEAKKAFSILYQCVQRNKKPEIYMAYMSLFIYPVKYDSSFLEVKEVARDCYVKLQMSDGTTKEYILVDKSSDNIEIDVHNELAQKLLDKKMGDEVEIRSSMPKILGKIIDVKSKYIYMFHKIGEDYNKLFPSDQSFLSIPFPVKPSGNTLPEDFVKLHEQRSKQVKRYDELFAMYMQRKATIGSISMLTKKHAVEVMGFLITSNKYKFISSIGTPKEYHDAFQILEKNSDILIDLSSLCIIHWIGIEDYILKSNYKLYICQSVINSIKLYIKELNRYSNDGQMVSYMENGRIRFQETAASVVKENIEFFEKIKSWAEKHCEIKPVPYTVNMPRDEKIKREKLIGKEFHDSLLVALNEDITFLCEDERLRSIFKTQGAWVFVLINIFYKKGIIDNDELLSLKAEIIKYNQSYIPIDSKFLLYLCEKYQYSLDISVKRGLEFLGPISKSQWAIFTTAWFLIDLWRKPVALQRIEEITKEALNQLAINRNVKTTIKKLKQVIQNELLFLPFEEERLCKFIDEYVTFQFIEKYEKPPIIYDPDE